MARTARSCRFQLHARVPGLQDLLRVGALCGRRGATVSSSSGNWGMADRMRTSARAGTKSVLTEGAARARVEEDRTRESLIVHTLTSSSHHIDVFPVFDNVSCVQMSCFWIVSRDACNELFRQTQVRVGLVPRYFERALRRAPLIEDEHTVSDTGGDWFSV